MKVDKDKSPIMNIKKTSETQAKETIIHEEHHSARVDVTIQYVLEADNGAMKSNKS